MASAELHPNEKITLGPLAGRIKAAGLGAGIALMTLAVIMGGVVGDGYKRFFHSYLMSFMFFLAITLGALFFVILHHLVKAKWSTVLRRLAECLTAGFPLLFILSFGILGPMLAGNHNLYIWVDHDMVHNDHLLHAKAGYLNPGFFAVRICIYFAVWLGVSHFFFKRSVKQDETGEVGLTNLMQKVAAPAMIGFAITTAMAAFDLLMSLYPHWFSTMFGVYYFAGCAMSIFAVLALVTILLHRSGRLTHSITVEHQHDVGKLLFAFVFFWAYVTFSQFMLIWMANLPEETEYFYPRLHTDWKYISIAVLLGHFVLPFVGLMSRNVKRRWWLLGAWATWLLGMQLLDLYWIIMPAYNSEHLVLHWTDGLCFLGMAGLFVAAVAHRAGRVKLIPVRDPNLAASLRFENV